MSGKASLRVVELLEKARIEGHWTQVSQLAEQLPKEYQVLKYISLGECMLEQKLQNSNYGESTALHIARDYINKALKIGEAKNDKHYKEALILLAKTNYIQGHFQECLDTLQTVDMDNMWEHMSLTFHVTRALADAYAYKGMAMEYLTQLQDDDSEHLSEVIRCYEAAGDIALELLNSISKSTVSLTISGVLEIALVRSVLLQMKYGTVEKGLERLRWIVQEADIVGSESLRITLIITLGQVLVQGITDDQWVAPTQHRDTVTRKQARNTPTMRRPYETHFTPCNRAEETLLATLISQALLYKEGCVSMEEEDVAAFAQTKRQVHMILNMLVMLLARFSLFRPLSDAIEKFMKFSNDDPHIWQQFALSLVASEQYTRAAAILEKCLSRTTNTILALILAKVYVNRLGQYDEAIKICHKYLKTCPNDPLKSRLYLMLGVAEGGLARSCHLIADQNVHNKRGLESILQAYAVDPLCPITIYHLTLRLACVGEIKKSMRYANKALTSGGQIAVDSSHLLCLLLTAQKRMEEALSVAELTLFDHPDNLNLLITKVVLEGTVHGGQKALVTCKEVLLPLLEKYSSPGESPAPYLPYSDQWNSGKFQVTQWSDRISTHTTASFSGSVVGTMAAESVAESIDSSVGQDQSNWGYQAEVWFTIAEVFLGEEMIPDAQKCVDEIKMLFPLSHLVSYMQGLIKEKEGLSVDAEQQYINAITINPQHIPSLIALGRLQMESGKALLAEHYLTEATKQSPNEYAAWHHLGCLYQRAGEHSKASEYFLTALRFEGSSPIRPYHVLQWKI